MSDSPPPPPPPGGYPPPQAPVPPPAPGVPGGYPPPGAYPPAGGDDAAPGGYVPPPGGPPPTQAGWGAGGGVPPAGGPPPPSGGGSRPIVIALIVVLGLAALVVVAAVALIALSSGEENDAPSVVRTTLPSATAPTIPPPTSTTDGAQPGDSALDPDDTTEDTAAGEEINVFDLSVGDCFNVPASGNITNVNGLDCDEPHENEVFAIFSIAGDDDAPFPGEASISRRAQRRCTGNLFTEYVGVSFDQSGFNATSINPTRQTWESELNDREVICVATSGDDSPLTASVQGAGE